MSQPSPSSYFGSSLFSLLWHDVRDRLQGNSARANARWGLVSAPEGRGKLVWIRAGKSAESVLLAAELLAAIRDKRQDLRLILSFEEDHAEIYAPRFQGLKKVAVGYGCSDRPGAVQRMLNRLQPFAVISVGEAAGKNFSRLVHQQVAHSILFQLSTPADVHAEACYPLLENDQPQCAHLAAVSDMRTLLVQQQIEPSFGGILRGQADYPLWTVLGADESFLSAWQQSELAAQSVLCVSAKNDAAQLKTHLDQLNVNAVLLSEWQREPVAAGSVLLLDDASWLPAVAASSTAVHLQQDVAGERWQALASGSAVSCRQAMAADDVIYEDTASLLAAWRGFVEKPFTARQAGDICRQRFWQQRRLAEENLQELLQRVYDW
jgi:hypothetical protein